LTGGEGVCYESPNRSESIFSIEGGNMIRSIYLLFLAGGLALCSAGCITLKDADGKGSRRLIVPLLTIATGRSDEKGETRTLTILPLTYYQKSIIQPNGTKVNQHTIALLASSWSDKTEATGNGEKEVFIVPLLLYYHKAITASAVGAAPGQTFQEDFQIVLALSGFHRSGKAGNVNSWGYVNLLGGWSREADYRVVRVLHLIPIPVAGKKPATAQQAPKTP